MNILPVSQLRRRNRLRNKMLLPFFFSIILFGAAATIGSIGFIRAVIEKSIDERLYATHEILYREIKSLEIKLSEYAKQLLFITNAVSSPLNDNENTTSLLLESFFATLGNDHIFVASFPGNAGDYLYYEPIQELFAQTLQVGQPKFRYLSQPGTVPTLAIASPFPERDNNRIGIYFLQTPMDKSFLTRLSPNSTYHITLLSATGVPIISNSDDISLPLLNAAQLSAIQRGEHLYLSSGSLFLSRHLFHAVPLGTNDKLILATSAKLNELGVIIETIALRSILTLLAALIVGGYVFIRMLNKLMQPINSLLIATDEVRRGNLDYRIDNISVNEFGLLATSFNDMTIDLKHLYEERMQRQNELAVANEKLNHQKTIAQKNYEIEKANHLLQEHITELTALFQLNQAMITTIDTKELFERIVETLHATLNCDMVVIFSYRDEDNCLKIVSSSGIDRELLDGVTMKLDEGITGLTARKQKLVYIKDMNVEKKNLNYKGKLKAHGSLVSVPLCVKMRTYGVINLHKNRTDGFLDNEFKLIQAAANQAAMALENALLYEQTKNLSYTDELTQLANRRYFFEVSKREMAQSIRFNSPLSLAMIDIDHFKRLNDTHGHLMGDRVLKKVAQLLNEHTREADIVGRYGGEEFIVLMPHTDLDGATNLAEKIRKLISCESFESLEQDQPEKSLTLSIGVTIFAPGDDDNIQQFIDRADRALYLAKCNGRNRCETLTIDTDHNTPNRSNVKT